MKEFNIFQVWCFFLKKMGKTIWDNLKDLIHTKKK